MNWYFTKRIFFSVFCLLVLICPTAHGAVTATVDRTTIALDETLNLTIGKDSGFFTSAPDLSPVENNFKVLGQNQSSSTQIINGNVTSSMEWNIVLAPKRAGALQIPAIAVGKEKTSPVNIKVVKQAAPKTTATDASIFIETDIDARSVYVQSQLLFTLRIYVVPGVQVQDPGVPQLQDAVVEKLDDASFDKRIDGRLYRVFELRYAIFPQKSGVLEIPQMIVKAALPGQQRYRDFFDRFGSQGKMVQLRSKSEKVTVKEKARSFPKSATWLPTDSLSIIDEWSQNPASLKVGESTTITISMAGQGLLGTQLPPIELSEIDGIKLYQGKAEVRNHTTGDGITGIRQESIALIPTKPGTIQLPEVRIPWWNKQNSLVEYALLPPRELIISGEVEKSAQPLKTPSAPATPLSVSPREPSSPLTTPPKRPLPWIASCVALAIAWLTTFLILLRTRRQLALVGAGEVMKEKEAQAMKEREAFKVLRNSCQNNDPLAARNALIEWAKTVWPKEKMHSLADLERLVPDQELTPVLQEIDTHLYSRDENKVPWQGSNLLETIKKIRKQFRTRKKNSDALEPLYK
jgi:hypothetical protein